MSTEKWIGGSGQGLTWGGCANSSDLASMASSSSVLSSCADIANGTALDIFCDVSVKGSTFTPSAPAYLGVYIYPLNQDGTTYGNNQFASGTQNTVIPSPSYYVGSMVLSTALSSHTGQLDRIVMPPGSFRFLFYNGAGAALSTTWTIAYRTYNRAIA